jgi:hypothetical protein
MDEQGTRELDKGTDKSRQGSDQGGAAAGAIGGSTNGGMSAGAIMEQAGNVARNLSEQASAASGALYQQGARAGDYVSRNVNEYPLPALLVAGAVGYGLAYLIHTQWQNWDWRDWQLGDWWGSQQRGARRDERNQRHAQHDRRN